MRKSSLTAYFTDPDIISHIYRQLDDLGFKGGRVLDPSMGSGNFFSAMPEELKQESDLYGVEIETLWTIVQTASSNSEHSNQRF